MIRGASRILVGVATLSVLASGPAPAAPIVPTTQLERVYFTCTGSKAQNLESTPAGWNKTPPAASLQQGGGCAKAEEFSIATTSFQGTFTGNTRSFTVELYSLPAAPGTTPVVGGSVPVRLVVDGTELISKQITLTPAAGPLPQSERLRFSVDNLPFMTEHGNGTTVRTYTLTVHRFVNADVELWGASDVPAGITFNPATLEPVVVTP